MEQPDIHHIRDLVLRGDYPEAFRSLPQAVQREAMKVRRQVSAVVKDVLRENPDAYQAEIINILAAGDVTRAAVFLAAHPSNDPQNIRENRRALSAARSLTERIVSETLGKSVTGVAQKQLHEMEMALVDELTPKVAPRLAAGEEKKRVEDFIKSEVLKRGREMKSGLKPRYIADAVPTKTFVSVESEKFGASDEALATDVFRAKPPPLAAWLAWMEGDHQVPSFETRDIFIDKKIAALQRNAQAKKDSGEPLNAWESNTFYHADRYRAELLEKANSFEHGRSFAHLIELVVIQLLLLYKEQVGLARVIKSSPEEDMFRGSDIVIQTKGKKWYSLDLTTAQNPETLGKKEEMTASWHGDVNLPNLRRMLVAEGSMKPYERMIVEPRVQQVNPALLGAITRQFIGRIKGTQIPLKNPEEFYQSTLREIWEQAAWAKKEDPVYEASRLVDFRAAA